MQKARLALREQYRAGSYWRVSVGIPPGVPWTLSPCSSGTSALPPKLRSPGFISSY